MPLQGSEGLSGVLATDGFIDDSLLKQKTNEGVRDIREALLQEIDEDILARLVTEVRLPNPEAGKNVAFEESQRSEVKKVLNITLCNFELLKRDKDAADSQFRTWRRDFAELLEDGGREGWIMNMATGKFPPSWLVEDQNATSVTKNAHYHDPATDAERSVIIAPPDIVKWYRIFFYAGMTKTELLSSGGLGASLRGLRVSLNELIGFLERNHQIDGVMDRIAKGE